MLYKRLAEQEKCDSEVAYKSMCVIWKGTAGEVQLLA